MTTQLPGTHASRPLPMQVGKVPVLSVIVPTRNEVDNIEPLLVRLQDALASIDAEVLVVDDSDDTTPELARQIATRSALSIRVHARPPGQRSGGLGGAVVVGFAEAFSPVCVVMDADLQHPPELLGTLLGVSRTGADFVIASRYLNGGGDEGLGGWYRHAVSILATWVAKRALRPELNGISDPMSGFFLVRRACLDLPSLRPQGFKLLLELLARHPEATVAEVPYTFNRRHSGASKAGFKEGITYLSRLAGLQAWARRSPHRPQRQLMSAAGGTGAGRTPAGPETAVTFRHQQRKMPTRGCD
jgi:dolichol-phosphate mannosyltransferase